MTEPKRTDVEYEEVCRSDLARAVEIVTELASYNVISEERAGYDDWLKEERGKQLASIRRVRDFIRAFTKRGGVR